MARYDATGVSESSTKWVQAEGKSALASMEVMKTLSASFSILSVCVSVCLYEDYGHTPLPIVMKFGMNTWYSGGSMCKYERTF